LDAELGLTRDGFSPWVMSLACRLTAYLSYAKTTLVLEAFWGWSPSTETVEQWALGVASEASAYMASGPPLAEADGEVLVIEVDGKAVRQRLRRSCRSDVDRGAASSVRAASVIGVKPSGVGPTRAKPAKSGEKRGTRARTAAAPP
jgi:hypothetical protein